MAFTEPFSDCKTFEPRIGSVKKNSARAMGPSVSGLMRTAAVTSKIRSKKALLHHIVAPRLGARVDACDNRRSRGPFFLHAMPARSPRKTPPYVVRHSPIHGRGVFARRTIRKGSRII